ncbi:hypothetical protein, partial [Streptomyces mayteni]
LRPLGLRLGPTPVPPPEAAPTAAPRPTRRIGRGWRTLPGRLAQLVRRGPLGRLTRLPRLGRSGPRGRRRRP